MTEVREQRTDGVEMSQLPANALVGCFFHSVDKETGRAIWQGQIIGNPEPGWYIVQLFEWLMGEPSYRKLVNFEEMTGWLFYDDAEGMRYSWEYGTARSGTKYHPREWDIIVPGRKP